MSDEHLSPLTAYRKANGVSLEAFGSKFRVDKSTVLRWERNGAPPDRVLAIEAETGISRHDLRPDIFGDAPTSSNEVAA